MGDTRKFSSRLIGWQKRHGRHDLPWQQTRDAYRIWLSEIMLQQTQVSTVIPYYARFTAQFPDVRALAAAPVATVLELWAGLGYYARARNLHRCAQRVVTDYAGRFPSDPVLLAALPGIGRSTAAAISAFAYGQKAAILDGNVKRVLARCFCVEGFPGNAQTEREMWALAESLLPSADIERYTQGLMDLGATCCTRANPGCGGCPMKDICLAHAQGRETELPVARPRRILPERDAHVLLLTDGQRVLLERRPSEGIWGGMLALPEWAHEDVEAFVRERGYALHGCEALKPQKHVFSHFKQTLWPLLCRVEPLRENSSEPGWEWCALDEADTTALPAPIRRLLRKAMPAV